MSMSVTPPEFTPRQIERFYTVLSYTGFILTESDAQESLPLPILLRSVISDTHQRSVLGSRYSISPIPMIESACSR